MYFLWVYDYFLTLGDEVRHPSIFRLRCQVLTATVQINYAWSGKKSWGEFRPPRLISNGLHGFPTVSALFIFVWHSKIPQVVTGLTILQNRYIPVLHIVYKNIAAFHFTESVSPSPRCYLDTVLTRPSVVVRFRPLYAQCILTVDFHPL